MTTKKVGFTTAISIVVANMVGAGVFTSLGYQTVTIQSIFPLLMLWIVGGIVALCGALSYGELAGLFPRSGGEYNFLSRVYHPAFGFLSGWVSATVGFSAPVALAAMALGRYLASTYAVLAGAEIYIALVVVLGITIIHATDVKLGSRFQVVTTAVKVILIVGFIFGGLFLTQSPQSISVLPQSGDTSLIFSSAFAISLAFVSFSYSGWNASAYLANEIENPRRNVPRSLFLGTLVVMLAYVLINFVFLYSVPVATLAAEQAKDFSTPLEVGYLSANSIFGTTGGKIMGTMIAILLISSISAMIFAGPRVTQVMGEDLPLLKFLGETNKNGVPTRAVILQSVISIILILTASFDSILYAIAFSLDIFTFSTVLGVIVMRIKNPQQERPYKTWGYPITPIIFLLATGWTMYFLLTQRVYESLVALAIVLAGLLVYLISGGIKKSS